MGKTISEEQAQEELLKGMAKITKEDFEIFMLKAKRLYEYLDLEVFQKFKGEMKTMLSLINDYKTGTYTNIPWLIITAIVSTFLYLLNPIDLIPDFLPVIGQIDDLAVLTVCLKLIEKDLNEYKKWKENLK